ncbi:B-cell differentiation antigen CD72-like [Hemicordylus capensis]|uniref:B-cell differentiation antigen CD72-like n=1 Tax=Hemicordylus capensis TaxID=884348 RepID=UPI0023034DEC|nr:B-cell differentiation antigen CD72-like [Hemicordylus capensis]
MSHGITYADLRFAKAPLEESQPPLAHPEEDLTYENIQLPRPQEEEEGPPRSAGGAAKASHRRAGYAALAAVLGACLFLLATSIGFGVRYWQVSRQLQQASRAHERERKAQAQRIGAQEGGLERSQQLLREAEMRLSSTRAALWESWEAGNRTRRRLEEQLEAVAQVQQQRQETGRRLNETEAKWQQATSCQQRGCCPCGWKLFRWKCLWISQEKETWANSRWACHEKSAQLLIVKKPWDAVGGKDAEILEPSNGYWIGLYKISSSRKWVWVDGSGYEGTLSSSYHSTYGALINGRLSGQASRESYHYICEKPAEDPGPPDPFPC